MNSRLHKYLNVSSNSMNAFTIILISLLLFLSSCETQPTVVDKPISDTTKVLAITLKQATSAEFMPSASALRRPSKFSDSILLTAIPFSLDLLPTKSGEQIFKVLPKETIHKILTGESYRHDVPNYLSITQFEKNDMGYYIQVQNLNILPFGGGGILGLYFKKSGDTLTIIDKASGSIN
jgi:hypothetical protein